MRLYKIGRLICLVAFSTTLTLSSAGRARAEEAKKIDFSATSKYVKDWAARDAFPDSPAFAYMNVFCQLALGGQVSEETKKKITEYLEKCQKPDGGFITDPNSKEGMLSASNAIFTYFALAALDLIGAPSAIDREKAVNFVLSLAQKDGGIKLTAQDAAANLGTTYYGVRSLYLLKALDRIDRNRTIEYIKSHRDDDKGFGVLPGKPSAPSPTFLAVDCLKLLGGLSDDVGQGVIRYMKETPYSGFREPENLALMSMSDTSNILEAAAKLSAVNQLNPEKIYEFVVSLYIMENGGFGPSPGLGAAPPSTYYAIVSLVYLGKLKDPYSPKNAGSND